MAKKDMGYGYGSEYQLLRFLGHHRNELEALIARETTLNAGNVYNFEWLDFPKDNSRKSLDNEYEGIGFFPQDIWSKIEVDWINFWPQTGAAPNWDAVLRLTPKNPSPALQDRWVIVEAKAQISEFDSCCQAGEEGKAKIEKAFCETQKAFGIAAPNSWLDKYYQFANRLAFVYFMRKNGLDGSLLNICFINGWAGKDPKLNVPDKETWEQKTEEVYAYLGINGEAKKYIHSVFVTC
jgi:hypothetical protein